MIRFSFQKGFIPLEVRHQKRLLMPSIRLLTGFTTIELLVVIAIMALFLGIVLASLTTTKGKSRDARRKQDVDQIVRAVNLYYNQNGTLPRSTGFCNRISSVSSQAFQLDISPTFIPSVPLDPTLTNQTGDYLYYNIDSNTGKYNFCAIMENSSASNGSYDYSGVPCNATVYNYCVSQ